MSFRKIVQSFCLGVIFSFLGLVVTLAKQGEVSPHPFKGINPPFPPPKNSISELLMNPKRTLAFMETDQATGIRFSLVRVVGGLPGGIPCVGGVNWPRGYEIVGKVPTDVNLANDTIAKSLVERGKTALFNFCPEASITETLNIWLFKDEVPTHQSYDYEVYASWETQYPAAPGPKIKTEYHNRALERAKHLAESRVKKVAPTRRSSTSSEVDSYVPTVSHSTYMEMKYERYIKLIKGIIVGIVLFVIMLIFLLPRESSGGEYSSYDYSEPDSEPEETDAPWVGGGMTGKRGEYTTIKNIERRSIPADSCNVTWEGNFGFVFKGEGKTLESNIDGPTKIQMGNRVFEKNWLTGEWEEK